MSICEKEKCTSCYACVNICPKNAVYMETDELGNLYPKINKEMCVDCGLCRKVCPSNNEINLNKPKHVYAAWALKDSERKSSTSGGAATIFSRAVIKNDGVVFGAALDKDMEVRHIQVSSEEGLNRLRGSKYVQSKIVDVYLKVKSNLEEDKKVIFIGTPCQVSGLKHFLRKDTYSNLITVDLVCHGIPSGKLLMDYIKDRGIDKFDSISFRDEKGFNLRLGLDGKEILNDPMDKCEYYRGFMNALFYRENCYRCPYACSERCGDITVGDFWGLGKEEKFDKSTEGGVSLVLVNTRRGEEFFDKCKEEIYYEERSLKEAVEGNSQLRSPSSRHKNNELFKKLYVRKGIRHAVKRSLLSDEIVEFIAQILRGNEKLYLFVRKIKRSIIKS